MKKVFIVVLLGIVLVIPAAAQNAQQTIPKDPMATWLHNAFNTNRKNIEKSAEKVPEELYGLRPGAAGGSADVRANSRAPRQLQLHVVLAGQGGKESRPGQRLREAGLQGSIASYFT